MKTYMVDGKRHHHHAGMRAEMAHPSFHIPKGNPPAYHPFEGTGARCAYCNGPRDSHAAAHPLVELPDGHNVDEDDLRAWSRAQWLELAKNVAFLLLLMAGVIAVLWIGG